MSRFRIPNPPEIDNAQLRAELETATGLTVASGAWDGPDLVVTFVIEGNDLTGDQQLRQLVQDTVYAHESTERQSLKVQALVDKARAVRAGTDSFTNNQIQQIVAALVLVEARRRG